MKEKHKMGYEGLLLIVFKNAEPNDLLPLRDKDRELIENSLSELTQKQEKVIKMWFAIGMEYHTLKQIGEVVWVTRAGAGEIKRKALVRLRRSKNAKHLKMLFRSTLEKMLEKSAEKSAQEISTLKKQNMALMAQIEKDKNAAAEMIYILQHIGSMDSRVSLVPTVFSRSVFELEISVRTYNCLKDANIRTIGDLVRKTQPEMLEIKNFGRKCLNELKEILESMDLRFGMYATG